MVFFNRNPITLRFFYQPVQIRIWISLFQKEITEAEMTKFLSQLKVKKTENSNILRTKLCLM